MTGLAPLLLAAMVLVPLGLLGAMLARPEARSWVPRWLWAAPLPGLAAALLGGEAPPLVLDPAGLRFTLGLDAPAALLLGVVALLWSAAGRYAATYLGGQPGAGRFAAWWLLTMAGSLGVFAAGDLIGFYLAFTLASLPAVGLVVFDRTRAARRAASVTLALAVLGEVCLLLAFALLAETVPGPSLAIADIVAGLPGSAARDVALGLLVAGFGVKAGLVPLHVWLPLAHPAAPMPASAVLSGAIIKAGVIGLLRFLPEGAGLADWGPALAVIGFVTAFWGVGCGITQANPKAVLAYSSVSQMGVVAAALGMGLVAADPGLTVAIAFYAAHHVLAKGALFLAVGVVALAAPGPGRRWVVLAPALVLALGFGGMPLTGGALAKAAVKDAFGTGLAAALSELSAIGSTLLMLHFVRRLAALPGQGAGRPGGGLVGPWIGLAAAAVLLPWCLYAALGLGDPAATLGGGALVEALWPVALGVGLAAALGRWGQGLAGRVPEGDVLALARHALMPGAAWGRWVRQAEATLRSWPAAGLALLAVAGAVALAAWAGARG